MVLNQSIPTKMVIIGRGSKLLINLIIFTLLLFQPAKYDEFYGDEGKEFKAYIQTPEPLSGWIRVRACCKPHGVFVDYVNTEA